MLDTKAPMIDLLDQDGQVFDIAQITSRYILLYFYSKDMTPGCTAQACDLQASWDKLQSYDCSVIGVSKDSPARHRKFIDKYELPFPLLCDPEGKLCQAYDVWVQKSMFGKSYMGIERSSFLINSQREICQIWRRVKPAAHINLVLDYLSSH